jgi:hypothetical protein
MFCLKIGEQLFVSRGLDDDRLDGDDFGFKNCELISNAVLVYPFAGLARSRKEAGGFGFRSGKLLHTKVNSPRFWKC